MLPFGALIPVLIFLFLLREGVPVFFEVFFRMPGPKPMLKRSIRILHQRATK